jgi:diadenylate cyclase
MPDGGFLNEWIRQPQLMNLLKVTGQIAFLTFIIYVIYIRFIRKSHAEQLLKGLFIMLLLFVGFYLFSALLRFEILTGVFAASIQILFIGLIVIFQPELRRMLLFLGQGELFGLGTLTASAEEQKAEYMIHEIGEAVHFLSKQKRGALIVLEAPTTHGGDYLEVGTALDAKLSTELLLTIFHPNTPLHDGAVIISPENRVVAAGVLLPLTEDPKLSWQYGTRHRAAIGLTEISDSRCIVISEESGSISLVEDGRLVKMSNAEELRKTLADIYQVTVDGVQPDKKPRFGQRLSELFSMGRREQKAASIKADKHPKSGTGL